MDAGMARDLLGDRSTACGCAGDFNLARLRLDHYGVTKGEQARMRKLHSLGCICCHLSNRYSEPCQIHHIVDKGYRKHSGGHMASLPLCGWHHEGIVPDGFTELRARKLYGPSLAHGSKPFATHWGSQRALLDQVNFLIGLPACA